MKIKNLTPAPYNPRTITDDKLAALGKSMQEFGDLSGVVMNIKTGNLVGGHQRMKHFDPSWPIKKRKHADTTGTVALGEIETPFGVWSYREVNWPREKELAANLAANRHGGAFDEPMLKDMFIEMEELTINHALTGFSEAEIDRLLERIPADGIPEVPMHESKGLVRRNFTSGMGEEEPVMDEEPAGNRYPITFVLDQSEYEKWRGVKERLGFNSDRTAFLKLIGGDHA